MLLSTSVLSKETRAKLHHRAPEKQAVILMCAWAMKVESRRRCRRRRRLVRLQRNSCGEVLGEVSNLAFVRTVQERGQRTQHSESHPVSPLHTSRGTAIHKYMQHD